MPKKNNLIEIESLNYKSIYNSLSLKLEKGSFYLLASKSSGGKTTLLKIISGLIKADGLIKFNNKDYQELNNNVIYKNIRFISLSIETPFKSNTVENEFFSKLNMLNITDKEKTEIYKEIIKELELGNTLSINPKELNNFDKLKLSIGLSLITKPEIILIDDICYNITKKERKDIQKKLNNLKIKYKLTILITSSNLIPIDYVDKILVLNNGIIELEGDRDNVLKEDSKLNRCNLEVPFIYDLSDKLMDYNLISNTITDIDRMVKALWK